MKLLLWSSFSKLKFTLYNIEEWSLQKNVKNENVSKSQHPTDTCLDSIVILYACGRRSVKLLLLFVSLGVTIVGCTDTLVLRPESRHPEKHFDVPMLFEQSVNRYVERVPLGKDWSDSLVVLSGHFLGVWSNSGYVLESELKFDGLATSETISNWEMYGSFCGTRLVPTKTYFTNSLDSLGKLHKTPTVLFETVDSVPFQTPEEVTNSCHVFTLYLVESYDDPPENRIRDSVVAKIPSAVIDTKGQ